MKLGLFLKLALAICVLAVPAASAAASAPNPQTPTQPLVVPSRGVDQQVASLAPNAAGIDGHGMKAVLLVGPIDGNSGNWTLEEIANMEQAALRLEAYGVTVYRFYTPNNDWEQIKAAANGANFLLYRGHGIYWSDMPSPIVGGFALSSKFASSSDIQNDLKLAPNAIVMLYGCFTAGSSGNDTSSISLDEAKRRVSQYSQPFFNLGAAGYYADWFGDAFASYVDNLFAGQTLGNAYKNYYDFDAGQMWYGTHNDFSNQAMWLGWDNWYPPTPQYNNAFVGNPNLTLADIADRLQISATQIGMLVEPGYTAQTFKLYLSSKYGQTFNWSIASNFLSSDTTWMNTSGSSGSNSQPVTVTINSGHPLGTYNATLTITTDHSSFPNNSISVPIRLTVASKIYRTYLPAVTR